MDCRVLMSAWIAILSLFLSSCVAGHTRIHRATANSIVFAEHDAPPLKGPETGKHGKGAECAFFLPFLVLKRPDVRIAVREALQDGNGDTLVNGRLYYFLLPLLIWNESCVIVEGQVIRKGGTE